MKHALSRCLLPLLMVFAMVGTESIFAGNDARKSRLYEKHPGWDASGEAEADCDSFVASIEAPDGLMHCPESVGEISFSATATYMSDEVDYDPDNFSYVWNIGEREYHGGEISHTFSDPGAYAIRLTVSQSQACQ